MLQMAEEAKNRRIKIAEVQYSGLRFLDALETATDTSWNVKHISTTQVLEESRRALGQGDVRGVYVGHVLKLNFDGSGALDFPEGLEWNDSGVRHCEEELGGKLWEKRLKEPSDGGLHIQSISGAKMQQRALSQACTSLRSWLCSFANF
jgi:hypothetical protein